MKRIPLVACVLLVATTGCKEENTDGDTGPSITCDRGEWGSSATIQEEITLNETYPGYTHIGGTLRINGETFTHVDTLICVEYVGWQLVIINNPLLVDIRGLRNITETGGALNVQQNAVLTNIDGLSGVTAVGTGSHDEPKFLQIFDNPMLENVDGLINLTSITNSLYIYNNDSLTNLDGLANLTSLGGDELLITTNPLLPNCEAEALAERLQANGFSGAVIIGGNDMEATCDL